MVCLFVSILGAETGNLALKVLATSGLSLGGGIRPRMLPACNERAVVAFLVSRASKAAVLREVRDSPDDPRRLPAQLIRPPNGSVRWWVDRAAGRLVCPDEKQGRT